MASEPEIALLREYELSNEDFERICRLVREQIGISLTDAKRELVYGRLSRRLRQLGLSGFGEYIARIEDGDQAELQQFCNAITTNMTSFFRECHHFDFLAKELLPQLTRRDAASSRIRIWSAGCSTGEEPYSIAMVVKETLDRIRNLDLRILATDIDSNVLEFARSGLYSTERLEKMEAARQQRWFSRAHADGLHAIGDDVKKLVTFNALNLVSPWPLQGPFDLIFCRNVIIYFDKETQRDIVGRMAALQRPGDHLLLGHSESLLGVCDQYQLVGRTIYQKVA